MKIFTLCCITFFFVSCNRSQMLEKKDWKWVKTIDAQGQVIEPVEEDAFVIKLNFDENKFTAKTDCNRFFGNFLIKNTSISFTNIGSTRMYCQGSQERVFIDQVEMADKYVLSKSGELVELIAADNSKIVLKSI